LTRVGWLRRVGGDEWEIVGARSIRRTSGVRHIASLAEDGPQKDHEVGPVAKEPEPVHRLLIRRVVYANLKQWVELCERPKGWVET
jgi:hypothetical protein